MRKPGKMSWDERSVIEGGYYIYNTLMLGAALAAILLSGPIPPPALGQEPSPLTEEDAYFLSKGGYCVEQGRVFDKDSAEPLSQEDLSFALEQARSKVRLKALMELNLVLNRYGPSEKISPEDLASVRRISRENWGVWTRETRETLKQYFSLRELQDMPSLTGGKAAAPTAPGTAATQPPSPQPGS